MGFARAVQQYHQGDITEQQLYSEVDRLVSVDPNDLSAMIAELERTMGALNISPQVAFQIRSRIAANTGQPISASVNEYSGPHGAMSNQPLPTDISGPRTPDFPAKQTGNPPLQVGTVLGNRFLLEKLLGEGGMSQVFLAEDLHAYGNPRVAVKVLSGAFSAHPDALVALKRETSKAQQLTHPNIVNVHDFGIDGPYTYMWMEYLAGGSLFDALRKTRGCGLPPTDAMAVLEGICAALSYAHGHKIVHADLKPGNVMFTVRDPDGTVNAKIIDFGIARPARALLGEDDQKTIYDPGDLRALTLPYASPEMQAGLDPDPRDDLYALGCIAYELFTGSHPFERVSAEQAKARGIEVKEHTTLNRHQFAAVLHALSFEREQRSVTAGEFLREFKRTERSGVAVPWKTLAVGALALAGLASFVFLKPFATDPNAPGRTFQDCPTCPTMTVITDGSFRQGSPDDAANSFANERPARSVSFSRPFAIGTTEVSVAEFKAFADDQDYAVKDCLIYRQDGWTRDGDRGWADPGFEQTAKHPVACVSWSDAVRYTDWLSNRTGFKYRLPSASQWEYTAAAGSTSAVWWDDQNRPPCAAANTADAAAGATYAAWKTIECTDANVHTAPVGAYEANPFGVHDSLGNVFEWVLDCWNPNYEGAPVDGSAWLQGDCGVRELRGGSWFTQPDFVTHRFRNRLPDDTRTSSIGFRVVREMNDTKE